MKREFSHHIKPEKLVGFPEAVRIKSKGTRPRYKNGNEYLEYDSMHDTVEVYNKNGKHIGEFDHITGNKISNAINGRKIDLSKNYKID